MNDITLMECIHQYQYAVVDKTDLRPELRINIVIQLHHAMNDLARAENKAGKALLAAQSTVNANLN